MDANLEWWANGSFMVGPFPSSSRTWESAGLREVAQLEDLRQTHDLDPAFTLRFGDDSTIEVVVGRPDDEGRFGLSALEENGPGEFTETDEYSRPLSVPPKAK